MFLLGHSCWGYLIVKYTGQRLRVNPPLYLALLAGILPDFDIYLQPLIQHHTITHSLLFLSPISILLTLRYKRLGIALSTGLLSHLLTDSIVGNIPLLYPLAQGTIGLNLGLPSQADTILETGSLALAFILALQNNDRHIFTRANKQALTTIIPLTAIVTLSLLYAGDNNIPLTSLAFSRKALTLITFGHAILITILLIGTVQGLRAYLAKQ